MINAGGANAAATTEPDDNSVNDDNIAELRQ